ncbi:MAG: hypothetical protein OEW97_02515 [Gammaproteobacteria bacterium]|nr:hypothetical protein [Gammaproteobacteria bacterium]
MKKLTFALFFTLLLLAGCETNPSSSMARQCQQGITTAYKELDFAKTSGLSGTVEYTKAATLLSGAKIQYEFGKYPNCIDKVTRARRFIKNSKIVK